MDENDLPQTNTQLIYSQSANTTNRPTIAGFLLLLSGIISIVLWANILSLDISAINSIIDIAELQKINPDITIEQIKNFLGICATIGIILSVFQILGGILSIKRKMWELCIIASAIGILNSLPLIIVTIIPLVALILIITSKKEFKNNKEKEKF